MSNATASGDYLKLFQISENRFIIGIYQKGITIYRQQVRALNLFHALVDTGKLKKGQGSVAIIGGGIGGLTFAAAARKAKINVTIFERAPFFLHLQYGCDTRKIHPNIYDWPDKGSTFPYADLPFLSWKYSTAQNVTKEIIYGFRQISEKEEPGCLYNEKRSCKVTGIYEEKTHCNVRWATEKEGDINEFSVVIYAIGYGVEVGVDSSVNTPSYWRNDEYDQHNLSKTQHNYIISGVGDGGLIDLFRLKIRGFSLDSILRDFSSLSTNYNDLAERLRLIKQDWVKIENSPPRRWLYERFRKDVEDLLGPVKDKLQDNFRNNVEITLNGKVEQEDILNLNAISLLNALIAFILMRLNAFHYEKGECEITGAKSCKLGSKQYTNATLIIQRHGTEKRKSLEEAFLTNDEIIALEAKQKSIFSFNTSNRRWGPGWWSEFLSEKDKRFQPRREFLTKETQSIAESFISVLSKVIEHFHEEIGDVNKNFRVTLHRLIDLNGTQYFQQMTPYYGTKIQSPNGGVRRVFDVSGGTVGLCFRSGRPLLLKKTSNKRFEETLKMFDLHDIKANYLSKDTATLFTLPILAKHNDGLATNLVLYIDSADLDFFDNEDIIKLIIKSTEGFLGSISGMLKKEQIVMSELDFSPVQIAYDQRQFKKFSKEKCFTDLAEANYLPPEKSTLIFDRFHSFNIILQNEHDQFEKY